MSIEARSLSLRSLLSGLLVTAAVMGTAGSAAATTLRMHSQIVESRPEAQFLQEFADDVSERSNGELTVEVYHAGSLGLKDPDLLRILQRGDIDMAMLYGEYFTRDAPELAAVYVQGAITEPEQHLELLPTLRGIYEEAYAEWNIKTVGGVVSPVFDVGIHCKQPVNTLEDLKSRKLRVWASHLVKTFQGLDVAAQVIPQNDMYVALQTGVIDCAYYLSTVAKTVSLQEVTDYEAYLHPWAAVPWMFGISERSWNNLSPEEQEILTTAGEAMWEKTKSLAVDPEREAAARAEREELGIEMLEPFSDADVEAFVESAKAEWKKMAEEAGPKGVEYYERMQTAIGELN
ncbi:TRAP transporter substrate-binding protein DctP [Lutibaculum baratangense]|uniref:TRAP-type C4-dicarboxylate transport system, periplasmic component n=1 Tax=Lutibaculum baratangense AMV1 TaxID=631454 RepID=V4R8M7_9HYPH|nr:TRAP transporter substrate-binding protein DctP [Lutibaculum baratangense]ESR22526.1 TRAP-type C4-dicarboxylate transport system, periplasmic component [Lutibaculum baratangense AMV1]